MSLHNKEFSDSERYDYERYDYLRKTRATIKYTRRAGEAHDYAEVHGHAWCRRATIDEAIDRLLDTPEWESEMNIEVHEAEKLENFCIESQRRRIAELEAENRILKEHLETTERQFQELLSLSNSAINSLRARFK